MVEFLTVVYLFYIFTTLYVTTLILMVFLKNKQDYFKEAPSDYCPSLSVLIPAYNEEKTILKTLDAVLKSEYPREKFEVIVINDGSTDSTEEKVKSYLRKYKELRLFSKENSGKADSMNQAVKIAKGDFVVIIDADSYPDKDSLIKMAKFFHDEEVGGVTGAAFVHNKNKILEKCQALEYVLIAWTRRLLDFLDSVYVTPGSLSMFRKKALEEIGGFDKNVMTEDIEVAWNLMKHGWKTRMSPSSYVFTTAPSYIKPWWRQRIRWNIGGFQTLGKHWKLLFKKGHVMLGQFVIPFFMAHLFISFSGFFVFSYVILRKLYEWFLFTFFSVSYDSQLVRLDDIYFLPTVFTFFAIVLFLTFFISSIYAFRTMKRSQIKLRIDFVVYTLFYLAAFPILLIASLYPLWRKEYKW